MPGSSRLSQKVEQGKAAFNDYREVRAAQSALRAVGLKTLAKNLSPAQLQSLYRTARLPDASHPVYQNRTFQWSDGTLKPPLTTPKALRTRYYDKVTDWKDYLSNRMLPDTERYKMWLELGNETMWHARLCFHPGSVDLFVDMAEWAIDHLPYIRKGEGKAEKEAERRDLRERMLACWLKAREIGFLAGWEELGGNRRRETWIREMESQGLYLDAWHRGNR
ncbi:MAG: hypothetical protein Q9195_001225 [Heterodermia aff. obscurata]